MSSITADTKSEALTKANRLFGAVKRLREEGAAIGERAIEAGSQIVIVPAWVYARTRWAETLGWNIPGTTIPAVPAGAALVALAGIGGVWGRASDSAVKFATPVVSGELALHAYVAGQAARVAKK